MRVAKLFAAILSLVFAVGCSYSGENYSEHNKEPVAVSEFHAVEDDSVSSDFAVPQYDGAPYVVVNDNNPFFTEEEITNSSYESYANLDELGRCGVAQACLGVDLMPTEERESISEVTPSGWVNNPYDFVDGGYLYNRCHLIGFQLAGENANEKNLITGTRSMNVDGMLPFENMTADYLKETGNHVMYRVTPIYNGNDLVATGVLMEAESVEDSGEGIEFCVFCFNVQPGVEIDYATGENWESGTRQSEKSIVQEYVLNTRTKKFHFPDCSSVEDIAKNNKETVTESRESLISNGFSPCKVCNP